MTMPMPKAEETIPAPPAAPPAVEPESFVINLCSSTTPMALTQPQLAQLKSYSFFVSRRLEDGRERFRLHMGYFDSLLQAEELLPVVRDLYPGAWAGEAPGKRLRARAALAADKPAPAVPSAAVPAEAVAPAAVPAAPAPTAGPSAELLAKMPTLSAAPEPSAVTPPLVLELVPQPARIAPPAPVAEPAPPVAAAAVVAAAPPPAAPRPWPAPVARSAPPACPLISARMCAKC